MSATSLPLRDVHLPPPPSWWPPPPGWWLVGGAVLCVLLVLSSWLIARRRRRRRWLAMFDAECAGAQAPAQRLAAASVLLRRAARRVDVHADALNGEAWLHFLDGRAGKRRDFSAGAGRLLLDGGYRPTLADAEVEPVLQLARARFLALMAGRR